MNFKRIAFLILYSSFFIFHSSFSFGQDRKDRMESIHIAYLTQKLNLSEDEAKTFWPVYNEFRAEMDKLSQECRDNIKMVKDAGGIDNLKDEDVKKLIASETDIETRELEVRKEYVQKFQQVLPIRKVAKLFVAEEQFKRYLLNQLGRRRQQHGGMTGGDDDDELK